MPLSPNVDIPLKEPIDIEFKLNKKLAKQLYELEMQEKVKLNREKQLQLMEEIKAKKIKKE